MTTTEALACGVPVIAADRGGLGEVAQGHAYMIEPSVDNVGHAIEPFCRTVLLRADLRRRARERGAALRWDKLALQTLDVIRDVANRKKRSH